MASAEKLTSAIEIPMTRGQVALVDAEDYRKYGGMKWVAQYNPCVDGYYAIRDVTVSPRKRKRLYLHRLICECPDGMVVDHINHDTLDNRRCNLRLATHSQNACNSLRGNPASGLRGVYQRGKKWASAIAMHGKQVHLGFFGTREEAAAAYRDAAKRLHGEFSPYYLVDR